MSEHLDRDTLVELQDQYSNVYPLSPTGARGWVRAKRELPKMEPEIYIEWDKTHWRYHGEPDGWTFEHHFRPVSDTLPDLHTDDGEPILNPLPEALRKFLDGQPKIEDILDQAQRQVDSERCPHCGDLHEESPFLSALMEAQDAALGSEGYLIITITPHREGGLVYYEPQIFLETLSDAAKHVIESQAVYIAAQLFEDYTHAKVQKVVKKRDQDGPGR